MNSVLQSPPPFTFDEAAHIYRDEHGLVLPSVTQCLKAEGFINFNHVNPAVLERKQKIGTLVHEASAQWDQGNLDEFEVPVIVLEYLQGYMNFRQDCDFVHRLVEVRSIAVVYGMRYGMCPDREGLLNGVPYILELKCGASEHPAWGLQLAAYDMGIPLGPRERRCRAALQLGSHFTRGYKLHPYEDPADYHIWNGTLANTIWKQNKKIFTVEPVPERFAA